MLRNIFTALALFFTGCALAGQAQGSAAKTADHRQEIEHQFDFQPGGALFLKNLHGQIEISGWDENRVEISAMKTVKGDEDPETAREWLEQVEVRINRKGSRVEVATSYPKKFDRFSFGSNPVEVSFWIKVPVRTNVEVKTVSGYTMVENLEGKISLNQVKGPVLVKRLRGKIEVNLVNGPVLVEEVRGKLETNVVNGSIQARLSGQDPSELHSVNGGISLTLPSKAAVNLEATTFNGEIKIDPRLRVEGSRTARNIEGKLNGGGPPVGVSSMNGKISIEAANGDN